MMAGMSLTSCSEDFLDVESKTEVNSQTFYKSEGDAWRALIGCYAGWRETTSNGNGLPLPFSTMIMSDECFAGAGMADAKNYSIADEFDMSPAPSYTSLWEGDWNAYYVAIDRCNELITREEQINWKSEETRGKYMGEVRALRAICYFDMVRMFENIPLLTEPSAANVEQAAPDSVYSLIFSDLKYAAENIPANAYPKSQAASNDGHVTRYGAAGMLARAYLYYKGRFNKEPEWCTQADALAACEEIIASGEFKLIDQFKNLWPASSSPALEKEKCSTFDEWIAQTTYAGEGNSEFIISMKCNYTQDYNGNNDGNRWIVNIGIRNIDSSPYGKGWGICSVNPQLVEAYGIGDQRMSASIIDHKAEGIDKISTFNDKCLMDSRQYTGYTVKKYTPMACTDGTSLAKVWGSPDDFMLNQWQDVIVLRYSDVLLMAAELGSPNAQQYFNEVRMRAYRQDDGTIHAGYTEIAATKENIMNERRLEFAFEGIRYYDLLRQGIDVAANAIATTQPVTSGGQPDVVTIKAENIKAKNGLCQIPMNQITLSNNVLKQNPGW